MVFLFCNFYEPKVFFQCLLIIDGITRTLKWITKEAQTSKNVLRFRLFLIQSSALFHDFGIQSAISGGLCVIIFVFLFHFFTSFLCHKPHEWKMRFVRVEKEFCIVLICCFLVLCFFTVFMFCLVLIKNVQNLEDDLARVGEISFCYKICFKSVVKGIDRMKLSDQQLEWSLADSVSCFCRNKFKRT